MKVEIYTLYNPTTERYWHALRRVTSIQDAFWFTNEGEASQTLANLKAEQDPLLDGFVVVKHTIETQTIF